MSQELVLMANIGAEEHAGAPPLPKARPGVRHLARLWQSVMPIPSRFISERARTHTPPASAAWPWLPSQPGLLPWLATPAALKRAHELNLPLLGPNPEVIDRVHDKAFALTQARRHTHVPDCLLETIRILDEPQSLDHARQLLTQTLASWPGWARQSFTVKPRRGTSGRGRIPGYDGVVTEHMVRGFYNLRSQGGAIMEPWLNRERDLSLQLHISEQGKVDVLATTTQLLSKSGVYFGNLGSFVDGTLRSSTCYDHALIEAGTTLGEEAAKHGFSGPCGIDAFIFRHPRDGQPTLRPVVELNARYTTATAGLAHLQNRFQDNQLPASGGWLFVLNASPELLDLASRAQELQVDTWYSSPENLCALVAWSHQLKPIEELARRAKLLNDVSITS